MRDKLIELIAPDRGCPYNADKYSDGGKLCKKCEYSTDLPCWAGVIADHLIAHGVTFADVPETNVGKWIPVSERLPKPHEDVLVYDNTAKEVTCACLSFLGEWFNVPMKNEVTHWMPLPEPPKEVEE